MYSCLFHYKKKIKIKIAHFSFIMPLFTSQGVDPLLEAALLVSIKHRYASLFYYTLACIRDTCTTYRSPLRYHHQILHAFLCIDYSWFFTKQICEVGANGYYYVIKYIYSTGQKRYFPGDVAVFNAIMYHKDYDCYPASPEKFYHVWMMVFVFGKIHYKPLHHALKI